jgi:hypothetical protein
VFDMAIKRVPWAIAAVMALTLTGQAAVAQPGDEVDPSAVANINADRIDGRHAVKSTGNVNLRKGRLMAFSAAGYLPGNIVQGGVATLAALQSTAGAVNEADNPVHWNQLLGVPATLADGADEGDGYDSSIATILGGNDLAIGASKWIAFDVPVGMDVEATVIPAVTVPPSIIEIQQSVMTRIDAATMRYHYFILNFAASPATTFKVRIRVFNQAIAPAALDQVADDIRVITSRKARP